MKTVEEFEDLLGQFQAKARCWHSQRKAKQLWNHLMPYLDTIPEWKTRLRIAWGHVDIEGPADLDQVCEDVLRDIKAQAEAWRIGREAARQRTVL